MYAEVEYATKICLSLQPTKKGCKEEEEIRIKKRLG